MRELFHGPLPTRTPLGLDAERLTILAAKSGSQESQWSLLRQYAGALRSARRIVTSEARQVSAEQLEDLESDLVLTALEVIRDFDLDAHDRLAKVLPNALRSVATQVATALVVPKGVLSRWFAVYREAAEQGVEAAELAPYRGMSADTYRAVQAALQHAESEWVTLPYGAAPPTADEETRRLADEAMSVLSPAERAVVEHAYGFRGDPTTDEETADILGSSRDTVKTQRRRSLNKMRVKLGAKPTD